MRIRFTNFKGASVKVLIVTALPCVILLAVYMLIKALYGVPDYSDNIWDAAIEIGEFSIPVYFPVRLIHFLVISLLITGVGGALRRPTAVMYQPVVFLAISILWYLFEMYDKRYHTNIGWAMISPLEEAIVCSFYTLATIPSSVILRMTGLVQCRLPERGETQFSSKKKSNIRYW